MLHQFPPKVVPTFFFLPDSFEFFVGFLCISRSPLKGKGVIFWHYSFKQLNCMGSRAEPGALIFSCQYISRVKNHAKIINFSLYTLSDNVCRSFRAYARVCITTSLFLISTLLKRELKQEDRNYLILPTAGNVSLNLSFVWFGKFGWIYWMVLNVWKQ